MSTSKNKSPFIQDLDPSLPKQDNPSQQPPSNKPSTPNQHEGCAWDDYELQLTNPNSNFRGSAWDDYSLRNSHQTQDSSHSNQNNSSQQNPSLDKVQLAFRLHQEGKTMNEIMSATGFTFTEAELNAIFSNLAQ